MNTPHVPAVVGVAACTAAAAHRRDHHHPTSAEACLPHTVEVVRLGDRAVAVCHDCAADSGFIPRRDAERLALEHQHATQAGSVALHAPAA